ncbi:hypothetical protein GGD81_002022 [Rhodobium orientis]|uniref:Uncharacterized protein n=1 Tax=Rhodobium orientis TaxID=34017 RepID=A0A327JUS2_9HYPH|nr:hypothetical protein [Rhodobium orientis]MBB4302984.1 hypothetical protein [Rhodobium orientis]MBK5949545.1 hypothetical protein [Rhodobium orientis]RAI29335.1 hypothetical protein CH339_03350 [Rhodobium orientis]
MSAGRVFLTGFAVAVIAGALCLLAVYVAGIGGARAPVAATPVEVSIPDGSALAEAVDAAASAQIVAAEKALGEEQIFAEKELARLTEQLAGITEDLNTISERVVRSYHGRSRSSGDRTWRSRPQRPRIQSGDPEMLARRRLYQRRAEALAETRAASETQIAAMRVQRENLEAAEGEPLADRIAAITDRDALIADAARRAERPAKITLEIVSEMWIGETYDAHLTIGRGTGSDAAGETFRAATPEPDALSADVAATPDVGAALSGSGFTVDPEGLTWVTVPEGRSDVISWTVTPAAEGRKTLKLTVRQRITVGEETIEIPVESFPRAVSVHVDLVTRIGATLGAVDKTTGKVKSIYEAVIGFGGAFTALGVIGGVISGFAAWIRKKIAGAPGKEPGKENGGPQERPPSPERSENDAAPAAGAPIPPP